MPDRYPGAKPSRWTAARTLPRNTNPPVDDVALQFGRLNPVGDYLALHDDDLIPGRKYTETNYGPNRAKNHFQGIQRLGPPNDDCVVISGGDFVAQRSHLFVCRVESRPKGRAFGTNLRFSRTPPPADRVVRVLALDSRYVHGGGMSLAGDLLVIPLEDAAAGASKIVFLDMTDPADPCELPERCTIPRSRDVGLAGAAAVTRLPNGHYLCGVWSDSDHLPSRLDCYLSKTRDFLDGFNPTPLSWEHRRLLPVGGRSPKFQAVNFVWQTDGALYLVATENTSGKAPLQDGDNRAHLLRVDFPPATTHSATPSLTAPTITRVAELRLQCEHDYGNFAAAAGVFLEPVRRPDRPEPTGRLMLYSAYHWRIDQRIRMTEFRQDRPATDPPVADVSDAWIDLFEHKEFRGRRLTILGDLDERIPDYEKVRVQDRDFGDAVSSVRYQIPPGRTYRLYRDQGFKPTTRDVVVLRGDGLVHEIPDLNAQGLNDAISSSCYDK
jgi:hypothetical protein